MDFHWSATACLGLLTVTHDDVITAQPGDTHQTLYRRICADLHTRLAKKADAEGEELPDGDLEIAHLHIAPNTLPA